MTKASDIYGKSLYDLALEEGCTESIMQEMTAVKQIFDENPDYITLLSEPSIRKAERIGLLNEAFGGELHPYHMNFLLVLLERGMLRGYGGCVKTFQRLYRQEKGIREAVVTSAVALSGEQKKALLSRLEEMSGSIVVLTERIDPSVLGGIRVDMDGQLFDGTVRGRLSDLRKKVSETVV